MILGEVSFLDCLTKAGALLRRAEVGSPDKVIIGRFGTCLAGTWRRQAAERRLEACNELHVTANGNMADNAGSNFYLAADVLKLETLL